MFLELEHLFSMPALWYAAMAALALLSWEAAFPRRGQLWSFPALLVYASVYLWYLMDLNVRLPVYREEWDDLAISAGLGQVLLFVAAFRLSLPALTTALTRNKASLERYPPVTDATRLFQLVLALWALILVIGIIHHGRGVVSALFPYESRSRWSFMFGRGRVGGSFDWLVSILGYTYRILVMLLGLLIFIPKRRGLQGLNIAAYALSLPYFVFLGTRTGFLEIIAPVGFGFLFFARMTAKRKALVLAAFLVAANAVMLLQIQYRQVGFDELVYVEDEEYTESGAAMHAGANMLQELLWMNYFLEEELLQLNHGKNYLILLAQFIPRALWPDKPVAGDEFTVLRGFMTSGGRIFGSVSTGIIGQGTNEFGRVFGPIACALFVALYAAWTARLREQRRNILRVLLGVAALAFIFGTFRGITLLSLWPVVFGYALVRVFEGGLADRAAAPAPSGARPRTATAPSPPHTPPAPLA